QLQQPFTEPILSGGAGPLARAMLRAKDANVRMLAAGYLGTLAQRQTADGFKGVAISGTLLKELAFKRDAADVPWAGGPLYVPSLGWDRAGAIKLFGALISWQLWADAHEKPEAKSQIANALSSVGLYGVLGNPPATGTTDTLQW